MISQENISGATPMGATLVAGGGATFRARAPRATAVYVNGVFGGAMQVDQNNDLLMAKDAKGYWTDFDVVYNHAGGFSVDLGGAFENALNSRHCVTAPGRPQCSPTISSA
jgi:hypothetical protein